MGGTPIGGIPMGPMGPMGGMMSRGMSMGGMPIAIIPIEAFGGGPPGSMGGMGGMGGMRGGMPMGGGIPPELLEQLFGGMGRGRG